MKVIEMEIKDNAMEKTNLMMCPPFLRKDFRTSQRLF
jgi:hypothetical protein